MGLDLAPDFPTFILLVSAESLFLLVPFIVFRLQHKSIRTEFIKRIATQPRPWWRRLIDIGIGAVCGYFFLDYGGFLEQIIYNLTIQTQSVQVYQQAAQGTVNTTPPSPPPPSTSTFNPWIFYGEMISGAILMFVAVGLCEEYMFRGVLQKEFSTKSKIVGLLGSSAIFMIYHIFPGIVPLLTTETFWLYHFGFGIILGLIVILQKGDLISSIIAHGTFDALIWVG